MSFELKICIILKEKIMS